MRTSHIFSVVLCTLPIFALSRMWSATSGEIMIQIEIPDGSADVTLTYTGPEGSANEFGVGFDATMMTGAYAVIFQNDGTNKERILAKTGGHTVLNDACCGWTVDTATTTDSVVTVVLTRAVTPEAEADGDTYDFNNLVNTAAGTAFSVITSYGSALYTSDTTKHSFRDKFDLSEMVPTSDPSLSPSASPVKSMDPSVSPTLAPTITGATVDPTTSPMAATTDPSVSPTGSPQMSPTMSPVESVGGCLVGADPVGGVSVVGLYDETAATVTIIATGPSDVWFGFGFGAVPRLMPDTYAITVGDADVTTERILGTYALGTDTVDTTGATFSVDTTGATRTVTFTRPIATDSGAFDFTELVECTTTSIGMISATGSGAVVDYHAEKMIGTLSNTCCPTPAPTAADVDGGTGSWAMRTSPHWIFVMCFVLSAYYSL